MLKAAIVGLGWWGKVILPLLKTSRKIEVVKAIDADPAAAAFAAAMPAAAQTTLNVVTAGDQNMVDYVNNYLGPKFEAMNPGVKVRAVGTGPGHGQ